MATDTKVSSLEQVKKTVAQHAESADRNAAFPESSIKSLADAGWMGLLVPEKFGGMDGDARQFAETARVLASACGSTGMIFVMHCCGVEVIRNLMKESPEKESLMRSIAKGKHLSTLACSERGTGTHFYASYSKSKRQNGAFHLNAEKCFITSSSFADSYVVSTQADGSDDPLVTSLYLVEKGGQGQEFIGKWEGMGLRANNSCAMKLRDFSVAETHLLGESGQGLSLSMSVILPRFLLGTAAVFTGIANAAYDACVHHVQSRKHEHTQEALAVLPTIRRSIAEMKVSIDACQRYLEYAADLFDEQPANPNLLIVLFEAKHLASKTAREVGLTASQVGGGIAYSAALSIERHLRDAMAGAVMAPTSDVLLDLIGKAALGQPLL
jgi:alkylation response protein AidB-like acyl-CoA dehydrogenase